MAKIGVAGSIKLAQNCLPHLSLCVVKKTAFCPKEFREIHVVQTADDNFFRYQVITQQP
jgi:hypothetical protein